MTTIVVARYKENIDWVRELHSDYEAVIYNKNSGSNLLSNVGRESHTYLTHIVTNYDNLDNFTVFTQGDPFAHCKDFVQRLNDLALSNLRYHYVGLSEGLITCDGNGRPHCGKTHLPITKLYEHLFNEKAPEVFVCNPAGQFGVSREIILRNPRSLYERALSALSYDVNPIEGFCMERLWTAIFGFKSEAKRSTLHYGEDPYITQGTYDAMCTAQDGSFVCLGELGFRVP